MTIPKKNILQYKQSFQSLYFYNILICLTDPLEPISRPIKDEMFEVKQNFIKLSRVGC